jgi:hypothetical protein
MHLVIHRKWGSKRSSGFIYIAPSYFCYKDVATDEVRKGEALAPNDTTWTVVAGPHWSRSGASRLESRL